MRPEINKLRLKVKMEDHDVLSNILDVTTVSRKRLLEAM
jgi:hypothetical protein